LIVIILYDITSTLSVYNCLHLSTTVYNCLQLSTHPYISMLYYNHI